MVNKELKAAGSSLQYKNLLGITLGTGFGAGVVINNVLLNGDNGCGGDVWLMRNKKHPAMIAEESVSIRAVKRYYRTFSGMDDSALTPENIYEIAEGVRAGDQKAAVASFSEMGEIAGAAIAQALNIVDGLVVIGGGLAGAAKYIFPSLVKELKTEVGMLSGERFPCVQIEVYNWEEEADRKRFLSVPTCKVCIPQTHIEVPYNKSKRIAILRSRNGANTSIMRGAYAFALQNLTNN